MTTIKETIKNLAEQQVICKNQRKTINLVGERTMSPSEATYKHEENRYQLRLLYLALGIIRGKDLETIDRNHAEVNMKAVNQLVEKYNGVAVHIGS